LSKVGIEKLKNNLKSIKNKLIEEYNVLKHKIKNQILTQYSRIEKQILELLTDQLED